MQLNLQQITLDLVSYGKNKFDLNKFIKPTNIPLPIFGNRPNGGLWASPINSKYGWKDWCKTKKYDFQKLDESITFKYSGRTIVIKEKADLNNLLWYKYIEGMGKGSQVKILEEQMKRLNQSYYPCVDFEKLLANDCDAVFLTLNGLVENDNLEKQNLNGWDCESIVILEPSCVMV